MGKAKGEVGFTLSPAGPGDIPHILELWQGLLSYHESLDPRYHRRKEAVDNFSEALKKMLADDNHHALIARAQGKAVGYILGRIAENTVYLAPARYGHITNLFVLKEWRRRGVGEELLKALTGWFQERGLESCQLSVLAQNNLGKAFWRRHGFSEFAEIWLKIQKTL